MAKQGTHWGEAMGLPPIGKAVTIVGIAIHRVVGGQMAVRWPQRAGHH